MSGFTGGPYQVGRFHSVVTGACLPGGRLTVQPLRSSVCVRRAMRLWRYEFTTPEPGVGLLRFRHVQSRARAVSSYTCFG